MATVWEVLGPLLPVFLSYGPQFRFCPHLLEQPPSHAVTGPEPLTIAQMIQILSKVLSKDIHHIRIPRFVGTLWMRRAGMLRRLVNAMGETFSAWNRDQYAHVSDAVLQVTGHAPSTYESWCRRHRDLFDGATTGSGGVAT